MRISSVNPVLWLVVNLHHMLSDGAAFTTQESYDIAYKLRNITFIITGDSLPIGSIWKHVVDIYH